MYYRLGEQCILRQEHFGAIICSTKKDLVFLNRTAADICEALEISPLTSREVEKLLKTLYSVSKGESLHTEVVAVLNELSEAGFLANSSERKRLNISEIAEAFRSKNNHQSPLYPTAPVAVNLCLTYNCNQNCLFCYLDPKLRFEEERGSLSEPELKRAIADFIDARVFKLTLTGGEPMMSFDLLCKVAEYIDNRIQVFVNTNGSYGDGISRQQARCLAKLNIRVQISIEATTPAVHDKLVGVRGAHRRAIRSVKNLTKEGVRVTLQTVPMKPNIDEVTPLLLWARKKRVDGMIVGYLIGSGEASRHFYELCPHPKDYESLIRLLIKYKRRLSGRFHINVTDPFAFLRDFESAWPLSWEPRRNPSSRFCGAGTYHVDIGPNGDLYPCPATHGMKRYQVGNIRQRSLIELWNDPRLSFFREASPGNLRNPICRTCRYSSSCKGGCPITAKSILGNENAGQPNCPNIWRTTCSAFCQAPKTSGPASTAAYVQPKLHKAAFL